MCVCQWENELGVAGCERGKPKTKGNLGNMPGRSRDNGLPIGSGPPGNGHAVTHGLHRFLRSGELPPGCDEIAAERDQYRDRLTAAVEARHSGVSHTRAEIISAAETHFVCGRLLERWLAEPGLSIDQRATLVRDIGRFADKRVERVVQLELDAADDGTLDVAGALQAIHRENALARTARDGNGRDEPSIDPHGSDAAASESANESGNGDASHAVEPAAGASLEASTAGDPGAADGQ